MSSDYIARLRGELVRAATVRQRRRRLLRLPALRPLVAAAAVALVAVAVVVAVDRGGSGSDELEFTVGAGTAEQAAAVMRERLQAGGVRDATVSVGSDGRLEIDAPPESRAAVAALTQPGEFAIYDWETSVLGPDGKPAEGVPDVTGGPDAGFWAPTSRAEAEARAAAAPGGGRVIGTPVGTPERWYALGAAPALTSDDVAGAQPIVDRFTNLPAVAVEFTRRGQDEFSELTRTIARRGADAREGQHLAMVLDGRIVAIPFIDYRENPDGIDGAGGAMISGGLSGHRARWIAAMLISGPLPAELLPASGG
jgi:preprotein translocase subunit SecD